MLQRRPVRERLPSTNPSLALIYVRQSRHKEGERTVSPEVQEQQCRGLAAVTACDRVEVFSDLDVSGGKLKGRKAFLALVDRIKGGAVSVVAAYDQSRGFRNTSDALDFYALMEKRPEIEVVFVHGRFDRSPAGEFTYTTLAAAHAMERRMTGEKIRDAYRYATRRGQMVGQVPGGYVRNPDGSVSIDEDVAPLVRRIFEMYATGRFTSRDIARRFNAEGVPKLPRSRGAAWHWHSIAEILRNVAYAGKAFSESRRRGGHGELIPATWPAIVSEGNWRAARSVSEPIRARWTERSARAPRLLIRRPASLFMRRATAWRREDSTQSRLLRLPPRAREAGRLR